MVDVQPTISRVAPLRDGAEWFAKLVDRQPGLMKVILVP
jgi:threonine dehydrogenase-like Zn-dependent dehydrogenase